MGRFSLRRLLVVLVCSVAAATAAACGSSSSAGSTPSAIQSGATGSSVSAPASSGSVGSSAPASSSLNTGPAIETQGADPGWNIISSAMSGEPQLEAKCQMVAPAASHQPTYKFWLQAASGEGAGVQSLLIKFTTSAGTVWFPDGLSEIQSPGMTVPYGPVSVPNDGVLVATSVAQVYPPNDPMPTACWVTQYNNP